MKKILSLFCLMMLAITSAWAGEVATLTLNGSEVSSPAGFFTHDTSGKFNFNNKFTGAEYAGITFTKGLKMEGSTKILFTTTEASTVTIVQSTWSETSVNLDDIVLEPSTAEAGTGCRIYTVADVAAGEHSIYRGGGSESGLFYVKVEWETTKTVTFINDVKWEKVFVWAWNDTENFTGGEWPGVEMTKISEDNFTWSTTGEPTFIVFNNGVTGDEGKEQTENFQFKDGGVYQYTGRIITLNDYTATFKTDGMDEVWAYVWNGEEKALGEWPGTKLTAEGEVYEVVIKAEEAPKFIIFHNNAGDQTPDWEFEEGKAYEYYLSEFTATFTTDAGWTDVYAWAWSENGGETKNYSAAWPGEKLEAEGDVYTYTLKAFVAPQSILFNGGDDSKKTADMEFINGRAYKWNTTLNPLFKLEASEEAIPAGTTVEVKDGEDVVATLTYGVSGGADFAAPSFRPNDEYAAFQYYTGGNGENGTADGGTVYTIKPVYDGTITVGVWLNGNKSFFIEEDGTALADYNGIKASYASGTAFEFAVKAGSEYKVYCTGSKLGFYGFDYKYAGGAATFNFADPNFREKIGDSLTDVTGYVYNETFTAGGVTLQITAGSAPSRIYEDAKRGQCLVTYKEYATLTFNAPEGKAITKIEFTAAGTSNIDSFTASSGVIDGMTWTGNADGVRFLQGGTSYLANAIVTLENETEATEILLPIEYKYCGNIADFNALEVGTYAWVDLKDAEVIGKSADGYSTVWIQDATGGCWIQYTSLNDKLSENSKVNGSFYVVKRATSGNSQMKEAEDTPASVFTTDGISIYTIQDGATIADVNTAENLNRIVRLTGCSFVATSATAGTLTLGDETITVNNGNATANQQLHKLEWEKGDEMKNVIIVAILSAKSATESQLLPISMEEAEFTVAGAFNTSEGSIDDPVFGKTWEPTIEANDMVRGTDGIYTLALNDVELSESGSIFYKVVKNHSWFTENWGFPEKTDGNADYYVELPVGYEKAVYDITFKFNPVANFENGYQVDCEVSLDDVATSIRSIDAEGTTDSVYTLQGVRVNCLQKGVNIVNGKKLVVK
jgi:hypothetical protein